MTSIVWFRRDLRLHDHPALLTAAGEGEVLPLLVLDPQQIEVSTPGAVAFLRCVAALDKSLVGRLVVRYGHPQEVLPQVARECGARRVHACAESEPYGRRRDDIVRAALAQVEVELVATGTPYAIGPGVLTKQDGDPYKVFTPFARAWREYDPPAPAPLPQVRWATGVRSDDPYPEPHVDAAIPVLGEAAAHARWAKFLVGDLARYDADRSRPDVDGTSRMSVHLSFGTIHPRTLVADLRTHPAGRTQGGQTFLTELIWREFYADVLFHRPDSERADLRTALAGMEYDDPETDPVVAERLQTWKDGRTGFPIVDAGMRQLLREGWMHNRVRMITASFLTKDLHVWWLHGAQHFLDHLVDGDVASNNHNWQWVAGTGTDAAPYFRVFNPWTQGAKFDPRGDYVRRYVPELADVEGGDVHDIRVVSTVPGYPTPIIDHAEERKEALRRYEAAR